MSRVIFTVVMPVVAMVGQIMPDDLLPREPAKTETVSSSLNLAPLLWWGGVVLLLAAAVGGLGWFCLRRYGNFSKW